MSSGISRPALAAIVVGYNSWRDLLLCLPALREEVAGRGGEVVLVDNASMDDTPARVPKEFPWVRIVRHTVNVGFAAGVNAGLEATAADFALVLNPDVTLYPGAADTLVEYLVEHPEVGIAGPRLLNPDGSTQPSCRRFHTLASVMSRRGPLRPLLVHTRWASQHLMLEWDHGAPQEVDWVLGACMLVRRSAIRDVGPMDEGFFLYFEDEDWCYRMWAKGWAVHYVPSAEARHGYRRESDRVSSPEYRHFVRSGMRLLCKLGLSARRPVPGRASAEAARAGASE